MYLPSAVPEAVVMVVMVLCGIAAPFAGFRVFVRLWVCDTPCGWLVLRGGWGLRIVISCRRNGAGPLSGSVILVCGKDHTDGVVA